jgi:hypothetical protein
MLKVFRIRKMMQNANVNMFDGDNLHPIFYLHQCFITSDKQMQDLLSFSFVP